MENAEKYYENTKNALPHPNVKLFIEMEKKAGKAIDLGCGAGRDTILLIKNNWSVLSIDRENTEKIIMEKLDKEELSKFRFDSQNFENINLEENDLTVANFSLPFCNKKYFKELWEKITNSISNGRIFCR